MFLLIYISTSIVRTCRIQPPALPTWQDCHELWIKKRKRLMKENASKHPVGDGVK